MQERMTILIADEKSKATIEFLPASGASGKLELTEPQLLTMIKALGGAHTYMVAGPELPALEGQQIEAIFNTTWYVNPELMGEASALSFYHPAFGPLGFLVPIEQVEHMIQLLSKQVEAAKSARAMPH